MIMLRHATRWIGSIALVAVAAGCASVQMASPEADAQAKQFNVPVGKSRIYVYRNENFGGAIKIAITLDGRLMGSTAPKTYFAWDVSPGKHDIMCAAENNSKLTVDAPSGRAVYVWQEMKMGMLSAGCALNLVDGATGRAGVMESKLAQSMQ
jgi:hypothetical protein